jgi:hypothetical protein
VVPTRYPALLIVAKDELAFLAEGLNDIGMCPTVSRNRAQSSAKPLLPQATAAVRPRPALEELFRTYGSAETGTLEEQSDNLAHASPIPW